MHLPLWTIAAAAALCAARTAAGADAPPAAECKPLQALTTIDLTIDERNVLVPVRIQGQRGALQLEIGSGYGMLWQTFVEQAKLRQSRVPVGLGLEAGGFKVRHLAAYDSIHVGELEFRKSKLPVGPPMPLRETAIGPVIGVMGMNFFGGVDFEIDLARRKLILFSTDHCKGQVVYWASKYQTVPMFRNVMGNMYFPMELDGEKVEATLSTNRPNSTLTREFARRLFNVDVQDTTQYHAMKLTAAGFEAEEVRIELVDPAMEECRFDVAMVRRTRAAGYANCTGVFPAILGRDVLEKLRLYFATRENVLYFTRADATQ